MNLRFLKWIILSLFSLKCEVFTKEVTINNLAGTWRLEDPEKKYKLDATVPGGIYTDLMKDGIIGDVFYGLNDTETRWVSKTGWTYFKTFQVDSTFLNYKKINLVFDGVDTFATVLVNSKKVGKTENMFVRYIFDVKSYLQLGENKIELQFKSPVIEAKARFNEQAKDYEVVPLCVPDEYNGECHVNHIRKMQASFSWDWGPALPSVGIWKNVYLEAYNFAVLRDVIVKTTTTPQADFWDVQFRIYLAGINNDPITGTTRISIKVGGQEVVEENTNPVEIENGEYLKTVDLKIKKTDVKLWWPNGYGDVNLYYVTVSHTDADADESGTETSKKTFRIGFRTIELVQNEIESGRQFYFKVNDVPIYAKGSNSIPINILPELGQNEKTIKFLLQSAKEVNMNMLRVWGGGTYEADVFYDIADELGILIWQDFMFACNMYPATPTFLSNVKEEVKHQVRRLQHHPSIILWAGNNENEAALRQNWYGTESNFDTFKRDYIKLYIDTIKKELLLNDDTRPYLTSSPTNGAESEKEEHVAVHPQSDFFGDVHFYNYVGDSWDPKTYPITRFSSEYGYQSLPSISTWLTATDNKNNLILSNSLLKSRQHLPGGYSKMEGLLNYRLEIPDIQVEENYEKLVFYSQILQAMAVKIETEYYRQWRTIINNEGRGYNMGALYWQLNDVWVAPTWSGIDFRNNWKMLHYYAKHFFAPIIVTGDLSPDGTLDIYIVSDLTNLISGAVLTIDVFKWNSLTPVHSETTIIDVGPQKSFLVKTLLVDKYLSKIKDEPCGTDGTKNCFFYFTLKDAEKKSIAPDNFVLPVPLKSDTIDTDAKLTVTDFALEVESGSPYYSMSVKADSVLLFVWLEVEGIPGRFSDNGFMQVVPTKTIYFYPEDKHKDFDQFVNSIRVTHLAEFEKLGKGGQGTIHKGYHYFFIYFMLLVFSKLL